jgi:hypothetical protein
MPRSIARWATVAGAGCLTAVAGALFARNILYCFFLVTRGGPGFDQLARFLAAAGAFNVASPFRIVTWAVVGAPGIVLIGRSVGWGPIGRSRLELCYGIGALAACSYRLTVLVAGVVLLVLGDQLHRRRLVDTGLRALVIALALVPADVTLRARPGAPHFVPVISGTWGMHAPRLDAEGRYAIVAGDEYLYVVEPRWVLVW